jgi:hypothetical protein
VVQPRYSAQGLGKSCARGKVSCFGRRNELMVRIGDDAFRHILLHMSLFLPVQNNCFMQLSGEPVYERYQHRPSQLLEQTSDIAPLSARRRKNKSKVIDKEPVGKTLKRAAIPR